MTSSKSAAHAPAVVLLAIVIAALQVSLIAACPFAGTGGDMPLDHTHSRRLMKGGPSASTTTTSSTSTSTAFCKEYYQTYNKCEGSPGSGFRPDFYENMGCTNLWPKIVSLLDDYNKHKNPGFLDNCYAGLIRNVFHMGVGTGHNAILMLEDWGKKGAAFPSPSSNSSTTRSAKYADPNRTLRCYDIYEYLRTEVDAYTAGETNSCKDVYVTCTDLANYVAKYAHMMLSNGIFVPCFNFGFADLEPTDFASHPLLLNPGTSPRAAAEKCLPPHDATDVNDPLPNKNSSFFQTAMDAFTKPCYASATGSYMSNEDLSNILMGHTVGESHCFHIELQSQEPYQDTAFWKKLVSDCNKCRTAIAVEGKEPKPNGTFAQMMTDNYSFARRCKSTGQQDMLPVGKTSGINRLADLAQIQINQIPDPCCVPNDVYSPDVFDFQYYPVVVGKYGLFEVDNELAINPATSGITIKWAECSQTLNLFQKYQVAWNKMNLIGAKPYAYYQKRLYCSVPSWAT